MKKCSKCNITKELSEFRKSAKSSDFLQSSCRVCENIDGDNYRKTKNGLVSVIYGNQKLSSIRRGHALPTYSNIELREWLLSQKKFHVLYDNWKRLDYQKMYSPSVDRKDDNIGYTLSNVQLMTWGENKAKGHRDMRSGKLTHGSKPQKPVIQYIKNGKTVKEFVSVKEAGRSTNISPQNISKCCLLKRKFAGGFMWRFK